MSKNISVPDIGDFKDVEIIEVLVKPGDQIKKNDPIVTLESDKSSVEVPSPYEGKISQLKVKIGDKVSEGSILATLDGGNEKKEEVVKPTKEIIEVEEMVSVPFEGFNTNANFLLVANANLAGTNEYNFGLLDDGTLDYGVTEQTGTVNDASLDDLGPNFEDESAEMILVAGAQGDDFLIGYNDYYGYEDQLVASVLVGGAGDDVLEINGGITEAIGGAGDDDFWVNSFEQDTIIFGGSSQFPENDKEQLKNQNKAK